MFTQKEPPGERRQRQETGVGAWVGMRLSSLETGDAVLVPTSLACHPPPFTLWVHVGYVLGVMAHRGYLALGEYGGTGPWNGCKWVFKPGAWEWLLKFWDYQPAPFYKSVYRRTLRVFVLFCF